MSVTLEPRRYTTVAIALHWLVLVLVLVQFATKLIPKGSFGLASRTLNAWHLAVGPTILLLMLVRLAWRLAHPAPPPPADLSAGVQRLSRATHWGFYAVLIVLPVLGWLSANGFGATVTLAGLFPLPALLGTDKPLAETIGGIHGVLAWILLALIALHVAGALYHAFVKRDRVIQRMVPAP